MTDLANQTDQQVYQNLAEEYRNNKKVAMDSILHCGQILFDARDRMGTGMFKHFCGDPRVAESERTAHRLISIYKNFRHILNNPDKLDIIAQLGVSHLLELKNLPERFTKQIEVVTEKAGEEIREICDVIDEDKLATFLEDTVDVHGQSTKVRDLTTAELRKVVNEQAGVFEPDSYFDDAKPNDKLDDVEVSEDLDTIAFTPKINGAIEVDVDKEQQSSEPVSTQNIADLLENTDRLLIHMNNIFGALRNLSSEEIAASNDKSKELLARRIPQIISNSEALVVQLPELKDKL